MELGDMIEVATTKLGVKTLVHNWLGDECGCEERKEKLNQLSMWAKQSAKLGKEQALEFLQSIMGDAKPPSLLSRFRRGGQAKRGSRGEGGCGGCGQHSQAPSNPQPANTANIPPQQEP